MPKSLLKAFHRRDQFQNDWIRSRAGSLSSWLAGRIGGFKFQ